MTIPRNIAIWGDQTKDVSHADQKECLRLEWEIATPHLANIGRNLHLLEYFLSCGRPPGGPPPAGPPAGGPGGPRDTPFAFSASGLGRCERTRLRVDICEVEVVVRRRTGGELTTVLTLSLLPMSCSISLSRTGWRVGEWERCRVGGSRLVSAIVRGGSREGEEERSEEGEEGEVEVEKEGRDPVQGRPRFS